MNILPKEKVVRFAIILIAILSLGITFYWMIREEGLYKIFLDWQIKEMGGYYPRISFLFIFLALAAGLCLIALPILSLLGFKITEAAAQPTTKDDRRKGLLIALLLIIVAILLFWIRAKFL